MPHAACALGPPAATRQGPHLYRDEQSPGLSLRLIQIYSRNEQFLKELARSRQAIEQAIAYLSQPAANPVLGRARLTQLRQKRSALLGFLRAHRLEVRQILELP